MELSVGRVVHHLHCPLPMFAVRQSLKNTEKLPQAGEAVQFDGLLQPAFAT